MTTSNARISLSLGLLLIAACDPRQPPRGRDYDIYHYGDFRYLSPADVVKLDNNHEILSTFKEPAKQDSLLQRGIEVTESQIEFLVLMGLLDRQAERLVTRIPMLDRDATERMRGLTAGAAASVADATQSAILDFKKELERRGQAGNTYPLLFAYILDGRVWELFSDAGLTGHETATPFWSGEVWAVSPSRGVDPGTITFWHDRAVMYVIWTEVAASRMAPFMADDRQLRELFASCVDRGRVESQALLDLFSPYGLVSKSGECAFPIFAERDGDSLYEAADTLAHQVADQAVSRLDLRKLVREFRFRDESQALVIAYHELMWDLVDDLVRSGTITRPALLDDPLAAEQEHVGNLVFVVRKSE